MIRYVLPAAVAALALNAPLAARAQVVQPVPQPQPAPNYTTNTSTSTTITGRPQPVHPGYTEETETYSTIGPALAPPLYPQPIPMVVSPRTTWIPGHYDWDPATSNYAWVEGQFVEAPRENAQWIPGHWTQTPTAWIWINGGWN